MTVFSILRSDIPAEGRPLTSTEIKALRAASGGRVSSRAFVIQANAPYRGYVFEPANEQEARATGQVVDRA